MNAIKRELEKRAHASGGGISQDKLARVCLFPDTFAARMHNQFRPIKRGLTDC